MNTVAAASRVTASAALAVVVIVTSVQWRSLPSPLGRRCPAGADEGLRRDVAMSTMLSSTPSMLVLISAFHTRNTSYPRAFNFCVRPASSWRLSASACCDPSRSTISIAASHRKSATYGPHGTCLRNFSPLNRRSRRRAHSFRSSSVCVRRNPRAMFVRRFVIQHTLHSHVQAPHLSLRDILSPWERKDSYFLLPWGEGAAPGAKAPRRWGPDEGLQRDLIVLPLSSPSPDLTRARTVRGRRGASCGRVERACVA